MAIIRDHDRGYRRGLVLGLTMAEIAVLIIFVLLLVLGTLLTRQYREAEALRDRVETLEAAKSEIDRITKTVGKDLTVIVRELASAKKDRDRLIVVEKELSRLEKLENELKAMRPGDSPDRPLPDLFRELVLIRESLADAGFPINPKMIPQSLEKARAAEEAIKELGDKDLSKVLIEKADLTRQLENLKAQMTNLKRQAEAGGRGLDHPPCWATPDGKAEYIFDLALTSKGIIIRDRDMPHRAADKAELPLSDMLFDKELPPSNFLSITLPLFRWSVANDCRFVVRAFDITGATEKPSYKRHMRVLEQRFYKYEELDEPFVR